MLALTLLIPIIYLTYFGITKSKNKLFTNSKTYLMLGIMFFITCLMFIFTPYVYLVAFDNIFTEKYINFQTNLFPNIHLNNFIFILRLLVYSTIPIVLVGFKYRNNILFRLLNIFYLPIVIVLNLIGLPFSCYAFTGSKSILVNLNSFGLSITLILLGFLGLSFIDHLYRIKEIKFANNINLITKAILTIWTLFVLITPNMGYGILFGRININHVSFAPAHLVIILLSLALPIISIIVIRKLSDETRDIILHVLAISIFFTFFDYYDFNSFYDLANLPLQLCNIAVPLILISVVFKNKHTFYFTYFINIVGAFFAIVLPGITNDVSITSPLGVHFWYEHIGIFSLPLIVVGTKYFPKPKLNDWVEQALIFTIYVMLVSLLNFYLPSVINHPRFGNTGVKADYLFLNGTDLADYVPLLKYARTKLVITNIINNKEVKLYLFHNVLVYIGLLATTSWLLGIYKIVFLIIKVIKNKKKSIKKLS